MGKIPPKRRGRNSKMDALMSQLNPKALTVEDLAKVLTVAGGKVATAETVRADLEAGAPSNPDGTVNLVEYTAWLARNPL